jgi:large subunit ribosomal protein L2
VGKIAPAKYPNFKLDEHHTGRVVDIVHERGRDAPLAKIQFDDGRYSYVPAPNGTIVGSTIEVGTSTAAKAGNILALASIPDGTVVCNIEKNTGDGGKLIKAAGSSAVVFAHGTEGVTIKFPSGRFLTLNQKCRAMVGAIAGAGRKEKPFLKAGTRAKYMQAHGGGRHQHVGRQSSVGRTTPPGRKVGIIAPRKTGRGRSKDLKQQRLA